MTLVLSLYPNSRGFGYACMEMPERILDTGMFTVKPLANDRLMAHVRRLTAYFEPAIIMVRDNAATTAKGRRVEQMGREIERFARAAGIPVHYYTRQQVREVFETFGATTKHEITQKIVGWFPELRNRVPKRMRKPWMNEDYNMGIFDAIALAVTHQYLTE